MKKGNQLRLEFPSPIVNAQPVQSIPAWKRTNTLPYWQRWQVVHYWNGFLNVDGVNRFVGWHTLAYLLDQTTTHVLLYIPKGFPYPWHTDHVVGTGLLADT